MGRLLLAGATGAPPAEQNAAPISYTVRMVEAEGVGWRESVMSQLKPVTRQGAATVWTLPKSASKSLIQEIAKSPVGRRPAGPARHGALRRARDDPGSRETASS